MGISIVINQFIQIYTMDSQVEQLLTEERAVNSQVKQALANKREKLATIQAFTERAVAQTRKELEQEKNAAIAEKKAAMERETAAAGSDNTMSVIEREFEQNKDAVIELLIENCMTVDTSIPRVVRGKFDEVQ